MQTRVTWLGQIACVRCGRSADTPPLTWSLQVGSRAGAEPAWLCEVCTRESLHDIEAKLDDLWR